jgi:succinate-semialdehyde dehydrogenase/glutarate-semialdehyde dehydrogenase
MENGGQACNAAKRIIVADAVYDQFVPLFTEKIAGYRTGNPTDPDVNYGPLSSARAAEILMEQIDDAIAKAAKMASEA